MEALHMKVQLASYNEQQLRLKRADDESRSALERC